MKDAPRPQTHTAPSRSSKNACNAAYHFDRDAQPRIAPDFPYGDYYLADAKGARKITCMFNYRTKRAGQSWELQRADLWKALVRRTQRAAQEGGVRMFTTLVFLFLGLGGGQEK